MILAIGEILFDVFPFYKRLGGAPFNFSYHIKSFGFPVHFISRVGNDRRGSEIVRMIDTNNFDCNGIQIDTNHKTGEVTIDLDNPSAPQYEIIKDVAYDYIDYTCTIDNILKKDISLFYFGSLIQRSEKSRETVRKILNRLDKNTKKIYDINLRKDCYSLQIITESLHQCDVLKINDEEVNLIKNILNYKENDSSFINTIMSTYSIDIVCLTRGALGSSIFTTNCSHDIKTKNSRIIDTVGAGDAYSSILAIGILCNWPMHQILQRANKFSEDICKIRGAIPSDPSFYNKYKHWIKDV